MQWSVDDALRGARQDFRRFARTGTVRFRNGGSREKKHEPSFRYPYLGCGHALGRRLQRRHAGHFRPRLFGEIRYCLGVADGPGGKRRLLGADIRKAASVEPILRFPARIGLARIENGRLTGIPPQEADAWLAMGKRLGSGFGTFVPISPLIAAAAATDVGLTYPRYGRPNVDKVLKRIRLGAARQHVDAVLIYEVAYSGENRITPLSVADLSIIGIFLAPSRWIRGRGVATALLMDVRNGYPYGTASATSRDGTLTTNAGSDSVKARIARLAGTQAAVALVPEVEKMARKVKAQAALRRPRPAQSGQ